MAGVDLIEVQKFLGHHSILTTVRYTHLTYHPHAHFVVPAAALDAERKRWRTKRRKRGNGGNGGNGGYLFNHKALAKVFRAKMLAVLDAAGLTVPLRAPKDWVVDCKSVGSGASALI